MKSKNFDQAEKFYVENKEKLIEILHAEFLGDIEYQVDKEQGWDQVAVRFPGFSLCYQDSDMNGKNKGEAHWNNDGADDGIDDLFEILKNDTRFDALIAEDEFWASEYLRQLISDFCADYAEKHKIANYFKCNQE